RTPVRLSGDARHAARRSPTGGHEAAAAGGYARAGRVGMTARPGGGSPPQGEVAGGLGAGGACRSRGGAQRACLAWEWANKIAGLIETGGGAGPLKPGQPSKPTISKRCQLLRGGREAHSPTDELL